LLELDESFVSSPMAVLRVWLVTKQERVEGNESRWILISCFDSNRFSSSLVVPRRVKQYQELQQWTLHPPQPRNSPRPSSSPPRLWCVCGSSLLCFSTSCADLLVRVQSAFKPAKVFRNHNDPSKQFTSLSFDSRGEYLITSNQDETLQLFDVRSGK
jgi:WD40 repeat protein